MNCSLFWDAHPYAINDSHTHINPTDLWFNLPGVSGKESEEALRSGVDDVDLVEGDRVDHLLPLLQLALGALHEPRTRTWEYKEETNELSCQQLEVTELPIMFKCDMKNYTSGDKNLNF